MDLSFHVVAGAHGEPHLEGHGVGVRPPAGVKRLAIGRAPVVLDVGRQLLHPQCKRSFDHFRSLAVEQHPGRATKNLISLAHLS